MWNWQSRLYKPDAERIDRSEADCLENITVSVMEAFSRSETRYTLVGSDVGWHGVHVVMTRGGAVGHVVVQYIHLDPTRS